jgi:hypothetical protein
VSANFAVIGHGVAARLDVAPVLGDERPEQTVAVTKVVLERRGVLGPGHPVDLAQAHAVDAVTGEQLLGGADQPVRRRPAIMHTH